MDTPGRDFARGAFIGRGCIRRAAPPYLAAMNFTSGRRIPSITPYGRLVHEVCLTENHGVWQARIMTLPRQVWVEPAGTRPLCFQAPSAAEAEALAVDFIQRDVISRGHRLENPAAAVGLRSPIEPARRLAVHLPLRYRQVGGQLAPTFRRTFMGTTGNLSESGLFIVTPTLLLPRARIRIELALPGLPSRLDGEVRWSRPESRIGLAAGMGVRLTDPSLEYRSRVQSL